MKTEQGTASVRKPVLFLVLGVILVGVAWWLTHPTREEQEIQRWLQEEQKIQHQRQEFFASHGIQLLSQEEQRDREAMERAGQQLASDFARYRSGVPSFASNLTTWTAQYQIAKAALRDWWSKSNEAQQLATDQFAKFVVSDRRLQADVIAVIAQFSSDLEANRNKMLSELQQKVSIAAVPCASADLGSTNLAGAFALTVEHLLEQEAKQSPIARVLAEGAGSIAGWAATGTIRGLITGLVTSMAVGVAKKAAAGGSTVAAEAIVEGGAGGTVLAPGVGTAIGLAGGIVVGGAVQWWMENKFKEKVASECNQILDDMEENLWNDPRQGLEMSFGQAITVTRECHQKALRKIITGEDK
jgi:hypothetical protein